MVLLFIRRTSCHSWDCIVPAVEVRMCC